MHGLGEYSASQAWGSAPEGCGQELGLYSIRSGNVETRRDSLGGQGFPYKESRSCVLGSGELAEAELEDCDQCVLGLLARCFQEVQDIGLDL